MKIQKKKNFGVGGIGGLGQGRVGGGVRVDGNREIFFGGSGQGGGGVGLGGVRVDGNGELKLL